jgi:transcriptional regulator with XRE-family HTH domain
LKLQERRARLKNFLPVPLWRVNYAANTSHRLFHNKSEGKVQAGKQMMKIGMTIRGYRLQKGLSQGDIEKRTGLLRCYLSRVENGHTVPSLDTLAKIAGALDLPLAQFFAEDSLGRELNTQKLTDDELRFLTQIRRYSSNLNDSDRKLLLAMVKKFAATAAK